MTTDEPIPCASKVKVDRQVWAQFELVSDCFSAEIEYPNDEREVYEKKSMKIRIEADGSVSLFVEQFDHVSHLKAVYLSYDEFFQRFCKEFFPDVM